MKYIIYWILSYSVQTVCPQPEPFTDEFGRVHENNYTTSQLCWRTIKEDHSKEFYAKDSAYSFYKRILVESGKKNIFGDSDIKNIRIDSLKVN